MANGDTKTEAMLNVLGNGGTGDEFRGCCNTKTQSYILDAIDRINAIQPGGSSDFNDLSNRPQLNGTAMTGNTNITNFTGTDGTNAGAQGLVPAPAAADADKFLKSDGTWATAGGGGGGEAIKTLTADDYNWNSSTQSATEPYNSVALWLLDPGFYVVDTGTTALIDRTTQLRRADMAMVGRYNSSFGTIPVGLFFAQATSDAGFQFGEFHSVIRSIGITTGTAPIAEVVDDLYSEYTKAALSANQGRILAERSNVLSPDAPGTDTEGVLGQLYTDTTNMHTYQCTAIDDSGDDPVYTWTQRW